MFGIWFHVLLLDAVNMDLRDRLSSRLAYEQTKELPVVFLNRFYFFLFPSMVSIHQSTFSLVVFYPLEFAWPAAAAAAAAELRDLMFWHSTSTAYGKLGNSCLCFSWFLG